MYFRTKSIKGSQLVQLVHSYRNAEGLPRQRVIASLGDAKLPEAEKYLIARAVDRRLHGLEDFFEASLSSEAAAWVDRIVRLADRSQAARPVPQTTVDGVVVDSINTTDVVELGPELVALKAWEELQFTPMLELDRLDRYGDGLKPVVILDAGFASRANLALLKDRGYSYIINITRGSRSKYADSFEKETFAPLPGRSDEQRVEVKRIADPEDSDSQLVLCRSAQRRMKEEAMISSAEKRFLAAAEALAKSIEKGAFKRASVIERKIGALQKRHARTARFYTLKHSAGRLEVIRDEEKMKSAIAQCGDYVLKTDKTLGPVQLWDLYMTLLQAESGFAQIKGPLGLRPNFHQLEDRVDGHIFISVLAYHLLRWITKRLEDHNDTRQWQTLRRILSTHSLVTTELQHEDNRTLHIRKASKPDEEQKRIYQMLGIDWKTAFPTKKTELKA